MHEDTMFPNFYKKKIVHLKGMMKGLKITDEEFENAKKSLFRV
jgi:hypothetical protein